MKKIIPILALSVVPFVAGAQTRINDLRDLFNFIIDIINGYLIPIVFSLALLYFLYGVANYIYKAGDVKSRQEGINIMLWGIIGLFVMTSVWGLVNILRGTFELNEQLPTPQFKIKR